MVAREGRVVELIKALKNIDLFSYISGENVPEM
jgi:hypothetical protein